MIFGTIAAVARDAIIVPVEYIIKNCAQNQNTTTKNYKSSSQDSCILLQTKSFCFRKYDRFTYYGFGHDIRVSVCNDGFKY